MKIRPREEAVIKATGKGWDDWFRLLDDAGMHHRDHRTIAARVKTSGCNKAWWQQTITVEYERARGLRDVHQRFDGHYEIGRTRTLQLSADDAVEMVRDESRRRMWLDVELNPPAQKVISGNPYFIFNWPDQRTTLHVVIEAKGSAKSTLTVVHRDLSGPAECEEKKAFWTAVLDKLKSGISF